MTYAIRCLAHANQMPSPESHSDCAKWLQRILFRGELKLREVPLDLSQMVDPEVERHRQNKGSTQGDRMVRSLSFLYGSFSITGGPIEIASEPMRSGKVEQRCGAEIKQVLSCVEPSGSRRPVQGPFEVFWRADVVCKHIVRCSQHRIREGCIFRASCLLRDRLGAQRNFKATGRVDRTMKIHRQPTEETQLLVGILMPLCERQRRIEGIANPFAVPGGEH